MTEAKHEHDWLLDVDLVKTKDGPPQPRQSIYLECVALTNQCSGFYRDNGIVKFIVFLTHKLAAFQAELSRYREAVECTWINEQEGKVFCWYCDAKATNDSGLTVHNQTCLVLAAANTGEEKTRMNENQRRPKR